MKRRTTYTACLKNDKIINAKTIAKLRAIAPQIRKVWLSTEYHGKGLDIQWSDRFMLDKLLKIPTKGRYVTEYTAGWVYLDSDWDDGILKTKASLRERYRAKHQHANRRCKRF